MDYTQLQHLLGTFLTDPSSDFESVALPLFRFQFQTNAPYRSYCQARGQSPETVTSWQDIPALPCDAFKHDPPVFCGNLTLASRHFLSSGTTNEVKSRHYFRETESYAHSIQAGWSRAQLPRLSPRYFLSKPPLSQPHSSLTFMFGTLAPRSPDNPHSWLMKKDGSLDPEPLRQESSPLLLFATALTLLQLFSEHPTPIPLPPGSWVFQTGGYKGLERDTDSEALYSAIATHLEVPTSHIINEYGMTELSSQAYSIGPHSAHRCPPWLRFRVINPETGEEQPTGEEGYLHLYDLANLGSVMAIRTQDIARAKNHSEFILQGRDPQALPRGCSRSDHSSLQASP